jgi:site-specific DNA-methyltransferase (adenine-specific)
VTEPVVIGPCTLYLGDCREILPTLSGVDAVVTDPPYGLEHSYGVHETDSGHRNTDFSELGTAAEGIEGWRAALKLCPEDGFAFAFTGSDIFGPCLAAARRVAMLTAKPFAWVKECPVPCGPNVKIGSGFELAVFAYGDGAWVGHDDPKRCNVFVCDSYRHGQPGKVDHPTQKPLRLMRWLVSGYCRPGSVVLDPFMGSGSTGVACVEEGRSFIGIERDQKHFDLACRRIRRAVSESRSLLPLEVAP